MITSDIPLVQRTGMAIQEGPSFLRNEIHVIISTLSGSQKASSYYDETLLPFLKSHNLNHVKHETESTHTITDLTEKIFLPQALKGAKQTVILLSGDGGVVDLVNALLSSSAGSRKEEYVPPTLALIPMGTANALAHSSGIAKDAMNTLQHGTPKSLPLFRVSFSPGAKLLTDEGRGREAVGSEDDSDRGILYGAVVFSWGLHASLVAMSDTTEMRKHGIDRFRIAAEALLRKGHEYKGVLSMLRNHSTNMGQKIDESTPLSYGEDSSLPADTHSYVLATLVSNLEENFKISPLSKPVDDHLRLVTIATSDSKELVRILGLAYQGGQHVNDAQVQYEDIEYGFRLDMMEAEEKWRCVCVDGKIIAVAEGGWVAVRRHTSEIAVVELVC